MGLKDLADKIPDEVKESAVKEGKEALKEVKDGKDAKEALKDAATDVVKGLKK